MTQSIDLSRATRMTRSQFAEAHPYLFVTWRSPVSRAASDVLWSLRTQDIGSLSEDPPHLAMEYQVRALAFGDLEDLHPDSLTVGRAPNNNIVIADVSVSARHAHFRRLRDQLCVQDVASRNGTWIAGRRLAAAEAVRVTAGDRIWFGRVLVELLSAGDCFDLLVAASELENG